MRDRFLVSLSVLAVAIAVVSLAPVPVAGQATAGVAKAGTVPRTPWGDPDMQGMWETRPRAPLERPAEFGTREFLTEQEAAERARRGFAAGGGDDEGDDATN